MRRFSNGTILAIALAIGVLLLVSLPVMALSGGGFDLSWHTVDSGGATISTGGGYSLGGSIGQPDAGVMAGGDYTLAGGFWAGGVLPSALNQIFLPLLVR